jgi:Baseplate J-like protein
MSATNVPIPVFTPTGLQTFDEQAILTGVQEDWVSAFALSGKTLNSELTTPQGQLQQSQAYMVAAFQAQLAQLIANVDPMTSAGIYQDALGRIYFLTRQAATFATVAATVTGTNGATLPAGSQVKSSDGTIWASVADAVYGVSGTAPVTFQSTIAGSVPAAGVNDLRIYQQVPNWVAVSNSAPSAPGTDTENRVEFETRRAASVQIGGVGQAANVRAAIANVTGVTDLYVYNNGGDTAVTYGTTSYPIPAHSIAVIVSGGADADVAEAINSKLDCGCGMSTSGGLGALVTVNVQDTINYVAPYPTYPVRFVRPATTQLYITVNVANLSTLPANYVLQVQKTVAAAFANGFTSNDGTIVIPRARIGGQIVASEYAAPILTLGNITPVTIFIGTSAAPASGASYTMGIDQQPVCPQLNITVNAISV